jgi:3-hydroxyisobutyrate dehydrogenase-like beta-hydroxyacid dehydrogenase
MSAASTTVGVLYPGEMGLALARVLAMRGHRVVTTIRGRSPSTAARCRDAQIETLDGIDRVVQESGVVFSIVPPPAASSVVQDYCRCAHLAPRDAIFVDANSIGPELAIELCGRVEASAATFVDASVNGLAKTLISGGTLFVSGPRCTEVSALFGDAMRVRPLGDRVGQASAMKMLLSAFAKGACAIYTEAALVAHQHGMLEQMQQAYAEIYPGISVVTERMLPTYPLHASRRAAEMAELQQTVRAAGIEPCVTAAIRLLHEQLAAAMPEESVGWTAVSLMNKLAADHFLSRPSLVADETSSVKEVVV